MVILVIFSFLAGVVTILSPCILPVLPIVLSSSLGKGKERPLGIVFGFVLSFTFFTLFLTTIVRFFGIPGESLRIFSVIVIFLFGLSLIFPKVQKLLERSFSYFSKFVPRSEKKEGFGGGLLIGLSIGLLWTPCVGPILASVISLALTGNVTFITFLITFFYSLGTGIPMLIVVYGGQKILGQVPWLLKNTVKIQKIFGVIMMLTAVSIYLNFDRKFQTFILEKFPDYGTGLTKIEENSAVYQQLKNINGNPNKENVGKTTSDLLQSAYMAPELTAGGEWFNLPEGKSSLTLQELRGKVVLIDFWTYTCINCIRTLPYLKSWDEKYRAQGLVIIGVHTPEFEFEKDPENVKKALNDFGIKYAVMQDNNYATWQAYNNNYWPAKYLIDKDGKIRYTHFGEGNYDQTEKIIQTLLEETGADVSGIPVNNQNYQIQAFTPETYLGYSRIENFASPEPISYDKASLYTKPGSLADNKFAFVGNWTIGEERAMPGAGARLYFNFSAKNVYLVMRPKAKSPGKIKVYINGEFVSSSQKGEDVKDSLVTVDSDRLYKLISLPDARRNELMLEFLDENLEVYAFTFG